MRAPPIVGPSDLRRSCPCLAPRSHREYHPSRLSFLGRGVYLVLWTRFSLRDTLVMSRYIFSPICESHSQTQRNESEPSNTKTDSEAMDRIRTEMRWPWTLVYCA